MDIKKKVFEILNSVNSEILEYKGDSLLEDSIIDSFDVMQIVELLENEFSVEFDSEYITAETFSTCDKIISMVKKHVEI